MTPVPTRRYILPIIILLFAFVGACEGTTTSDIESIAETILPTPDLDATVQAAISATTLSTDSLSTAVAAAISETATAQPAHTSTPVVSTPIANPTADVRPVVLPQATISPTAIPTPTSVALPTEIPTPTVVRPTATRVPPPSTQTTVSTVISSPTATTTPTATPSPVPTSTSTPTATPAPLSLDQLVEKSSAAVVRIASATGVGSGVIFRLVGPEAYVLTNQHVVGTSSSVTVRIDDTTDFTGDVVSTDITRDLAIVKVCCSSDFLALVFANPDDVKLGKTVAVLGYPLGFNSLRVSQGIVSGVESEPAKSRDVIQTDAAINPGNSGGPLLLMDGRIAGISTYKLLATNSGVPTEGLGFAVSVSTIVEVIESMISGVTATKVEPTPHPDTVNGKYTSPLYGYEIDVPTGWSLDNADQSALSVWDEFSGAVIFVEFSDDFPGYYSIADWSQDWTYLGQSWQDSIKNLSEGTIFTGYAGTDSSATLQGIEFKNTFEVDGELFRDFTQLFYEAGRLWFVSIYVPNSIWTSPEYAEYRLAIQFAAISFNPPVQGAAAIPAPATPTPTPLPATAISPTATPVPVVYEASFTAPSGIGEFDDLQITPPLHRGFAGYSDLTVLDANRNIYECITVNSVMYWGDDENPAIVRIQRVCDKGAPGPPILQWFGYP
jgi:S1-C subfamily serine protease